VSRTAGRGPAASEQFWSQLQSLVSSSRIVVDRPRGSSHPRRPEVVYPYDYGYLAGTAAGDGEGIDVWLGTLETRTVTGVVCTVDADKRDVEVKILLGCSGDEQSAILAFHNRGSQAGVLVERGEA
jgi:inorganic pyrophosphatase